ncbi:MAG TPA: BamA/TamA family outer membrane protein [Kofleriaceae bacterium]|nr:BamA/TamA family outer membrane protein [Kofleriaceae bacterium]
MRAIRESVALAAVVACTALVPGTAHAQATSAPDDVVARPGQESGRIDDVEDEDSAARQVGRGVLWVPRAAFGVAMVPVRGTVYLADRYRLGDRARRWFFNDEGTFGVFPVVGWDSGFGPNGGLKLVARDLFGHEEQAEAKGVIGWSSRATALGRFSTGELLGERTTLGFEALFDRNPAQRFFGFGNGDEIDPRDDELINPNVDNRAVETRFRQRQAQLAAVLDVRPFDGFHIRPGARIADVRVSNDIASGLSEPAIDRVYDVMTITGFPEYKIGYGELELRLDTRRSWDDYESLAMPSQGWLVSAFAGRAAVDVGDDFWRLGFDVHRLFHLGTGPRSLALRLHGEGVTGDRMDTPFTELPSLGGPFMLRGYDLDRFRDRIAAVASAEYAWDLAEAVAASLFVDAGRVFPALDEITLDNTRVGFGVGLQVHTAHFLLTRAQLASSIDGGLFLNLAFEPAFEPQPRVTRRNR